MAKNVAVLREALQRLGQPQHGGAIARAQLDPIAERLLREVDQIHGGIGTAPKFPQCGIFELLWRGWKRTGETAYRDAVMKALDAMCQGGIYDHLGGGFARYSTDARWLVPHFEKMLYDNAELVDLLTLVWQETANPLYRAAGRETIGWVEREMPGAGRRLRQQPRCRQRARGRQVLRLDRGRDRRGARRPRAPLFKRFTT